MEEKQGCCFRCEWRAKYLEAGHGPRAECGNIENNCHGCYMYKPVMPVIMGVDEYEEEFKKKHGVGRPIFGPAMLSARMHFVGLPKEEMGLAVKEVKEGVVLYWKFKGEKKGEQ